MTRTFVTFHTDRFNSTEVGAHVINPGCFGEDCAAWLVGELRAARVGDLDDPWQEDWEWQAGIGSGDAKFLLSVGLMEDEEEDGPLARAHGVRARPIRRRAASVRVGSGL